MVRRTNTRGTFHPLSTQAPTQVARAAATSTAKIRNTTPDELECRPGNIERRLIKYVPNHQIGTPPVTNLVRTEPVDTGIVPTPEQYNAELATHLGAINQTRGEALPIARSGAEHTASLAGSIISAPAELVCRTLATLDDTSRWAWAKCRNMTRKGGWKAGLGAVLLPLVAPLRVVTTVANVLAKFLDAPFALLRKNLHDSGKRITTEREVPRKEAEHLRVAPDSWPELAANAGVNQRVRAWVADGRPGNYKHDVIVVPGYTTDDETAPLSHATKKRLDQAVLDLSCGKAPFLLVSGGNCHPSGTRFNEAFEMKRYLVEQCGVNADQIILEPMAQHSTTNLRNAGRYMQRMGLERALLTSDDTPLVGQSSYFANADSVFYGVHMRSLAENGVRFGDLSRVDHCHTTFTPSDAVHLCDPKEPLDP